MIRAQLAARHPRTIVCLASRIVICTNDIAG